MEGDDGELVELRARVTLHSDGVAMFRQVRRASERSNTILFGKLDELIQEHGCSLLIIDLQDAERPDRKMRANAQGHLQKLGERIEHIAIVSGKNYWMNMVAKFVLSGVPQRYTIHTTLAEAERAIGQSARG